MQDPTAGKLLSTMDDECQQGARFDLLDNKCYTPAACPLTKPSNRLQFGILFLACRLKSLKPLCTLTALPSVLSSRALFRGLVIGC